VLPARRLRWRAGWRIQLVLIAIRDAAVCAQQSSIALEPQAAQAAWSAPHGQQRTCTWLWPACDQHVRLQHSGKRPPGPQHCNSLGHFHASTAAARSWSTTAGPASLAQPSFEAHAGSSLSLCTHQSRLHSSVRGRCCLPCTHNLCARLQAAAVAHSQAQQLRHSPRGTSRAALVPASHIHKDWCIGRCLGCYACCNLSSHASRAPGLHAAWHQQARSHQLPLAPRGPHACDPPHGPCCRWQCSTMLSPQTMAHMPS
jgi:hypothetical protein